MTEKIRGDNRIQKMEKIMARIQTRKVRFQQFWLFLNSAFCIWFLSAVVLGSITFFYSQYTSARKEDEQRRLIIHRLDTEIKSRLYYIAEQSNPDKFDVENFKNMLLSIENPEHSKYPIGVFPEFKKRNMRALLWELHTAVSKDAKPAIKKALDAAFELRELYEKKINFDISAEAGEIEKKVNEIFEKAIGSYHFRTKFAPLNLERWALPFTTQWGKQNKD